jgi:hypothetical protein
MFWHRFFMDLLYIGYEKAKHINCFIFVEFSNVLMIHAVGYSGNLEKLLKN